MAGGAGAWTRAATFASADEIFISGLSAAEIGADVSFCAKGDAGCTGAFGGMEGGVCAGIWGLVCAGVDAPAAGPLGRPASDGIDEAEVMSLAATAGVVTGTSGFRTMGSGFGTIGAGTGCRTASTSRCTGPWLATTGESVTEAVT